MFWITIIQLWLILPCWCRLAEELPMISKDSCLTSSCFYQPAENCPKLQDKCRCQQVKHCRNAAICCDISTKFQLTESLACASELNGYKQQK